MTNKNDFYNQIKSFFTGWGIVGLYFILPILISSPLASVISKLTKNDQYFLLSLIYLLIQILTTSIFVFLYRRDLKNDMIDFKKNHRQQLKTVINIWALGLFAMVITNFVINYFITGGTIANNELANRNFLTLYPLFAYPAIIIFGPIIEELVFRKSFKPAFKKMLPFVLFTGLLFSSIHVVTSMTSAKDLLYLIPYGTLGIAFSYMYFKTNNIVTNILVHIMHNSLTLAIIFIYNI